MMTMLVVVWCFACICVSTAAGVLLFGDVWQCKTAAEIEETELDRWLENGSSGCVETLEQIGEHRKYKQRMCIVMRTTHSYLDPCKV